MSRSSREEQDSPGGYFRPPASPSPGCDIVKKGCLYVKRPPGKKSVKLSLKTWQKKYIVLRDDWKESCTAILDIYDRESDATRVDGKSPAPSFFFFPSRPYTVDLRTVMNVDIYLESRTFVHALIVIRSNGFPVILGAQSELEMKGWMAAIKLLADKANQLCPRLQRPPSCPPRVGREVKRPLNGALSLASELNRSTPQLFKVVGKAHHFSISREISISSTVLARASGCVIDIQESNDGRSSRSSSVRTPVLSDLQSFKRIPSSPFFQNPGKETGSKWRPFSNMNRKDSGFSESFDESGDQGHSTSYTPPEDTVEEEDNSSSYSPPPLPPRQLSNPLSPSTRTFGQELLLFGGPCPPKPPPRPVHTLPNTYP